MAEPLRLIIDTDTAGDDVTALMLALRSPTVAVEAVTIVAGNVAFEQQVENALYTIEQAGRGGEVPVFAGCRTPLRRPGRTVPDVHGLDGMGESFFPKATHRPEARHAVNAMIERVTAAPGRITFVMLGPLTNLAAALRQAPDLAQDIRHVYVMGGAVFGQGNVTPVAEYNIWHDPDAAARVVQSGLAITLVPWETALRNGRVPDTLFDDRETLDVAFIRQVNRLARAYDVKHWGGQGSVHPDALTMAIALDPSLVTDIRRRHVAVETDGEIARGMTVVDHDERFGGTPNVDVVYEANGRRFRRMLRNRLGCDASEGLF